VTRIAAFDVDGTLTRRDCVVPFMREIAGTPVVVSRLLRAPARLGSAAWRRDRDDLKAMSAGAAFRGVAFTDLQASAERFAERVHREWLRSEIVEHLDDHRRSNDVVVLVSASFEVYVEPLARRLGAHHALASRLEVDETGRLTGALEGPNCRGPEKVRRLHEWLESAHGGRSAVHVTAYGDSPGDRELLADADVARWVGKREITG
jgi:phosphatidylglycerophosphatase C